MKTTLLALGFLSFAITAAYAQEVNDTHAIVGKMESDLSKRMSTNLDRAYVGAMTAIEPAVIALCRKEIADGKQAKVRATAQKILTIEQENEAYLKGYQQTYHIDHTP